MRTKLAITLGVLAVTTLMAEPLTKEERSRGMSHLHATRKMFLDSLSGVSDAQWNFKAAPDRWSIAECAEHIALSEDLIYQSAIGMLKSPANPEKKAAAAGKDEVILKMIPDRSVKAQAPEVLQPKRTWADRDSLIDHFKKSRDRNIAYIETTQEDLRSHLIDHPALKTMDAYQMILLLSAHSERHTAQINEVKTATGYPKR